MKVSPPTMKAVRASMRVSPPARKAMKKSMKAMKKSMKVSPPWEKAKKAVKAVKGRKAGKGRGSRKGGAASGSETDPDVMFFGEPDPAGGFFGGRFAKKAMGNGKGNHGDEDPPVRWKKRRMQKMQFEEKYGEMMQQAWDEMCAHRRNYADKVEELGGPVTPDYYPTCPWAEALASNCDEDV